MGKKKIISKRILKKGIKKNLKKEYKELLNTFVIRTALVIIIIGFLIFFSAGSFLFWQAWVLLIIIFAPVIIAGIYLFKKNPELLFLRMKKNWKEKPQKLITALFFLFFGLVLIIPGIDFRFDWSDLSIFIVLTSDLAILFGYFIFFLVFKENFFISKSASNKKNKKVLSTGPYSIIRHPVYLGILLMFVFIPLALGSVWTTFAVIPIVAAIILRLNKEEKDLLKDLKGFKAYTKKVRYRLLPYVW